jgi:hypothetical protein
LYGSDLGETPAAQPKSNTMFIERIYLPVHMHRETIWKGLLKSTEQTKADIVWSDKTDGIVVEPRLFLPH